MEKIRKVITKINIYTFYLWGEYGVSVEFVRQPKDTYAGYWSIHHNPTPASLERVKRLIHV